MRKHFISSLVAALLAFPAVAETPGGGCGNLLIILADRTPGTCVIKDTTCSKGKHWRTTNPKYSDNLPGVVVTGQALGPGPDCQTTVECGSDTSVMRTQQNQCEFSAGDIEAKVISGPCELREIRTGSFGLDIPGMVFFACG